MSRRRRALVELAVVAVAPLALRHPAISRYEYRALGTVVRRRPDCLRALLSVLTEMGGVLPVTLAASTAASCAKRQGVPDSEIARTLAVGAGGILARRALAESVRRSRPPKQWWWSTPSGFSYPSRHAAWIVLGCGAVADLSRARGPGACPAAGRTLIATVGITRVVLAVHWPSDVVAGLVFSSAWRHVWSRND